MLLRKTKSCRAGVRMLLAIDTSTRHAGVALWSEDRPIMSLSWYSSRNHTAELMPAIENILEKAGAGPAALSAIAVALGPGGFSALRVGISVARGLAPPSNLPVVGVGTLEMEAYPYGGAGLPICPVLDVGRGEVASAIFRKSGGRWRKLKEEHISTPEELAESVSEPTLFCGEAVPLHGEELRRSLGDNAMVLDFHAPASRLWALGVLAGERLKESDPRGETIRPLYLRRPNIGVARTPSKVRQ